jgi:hypothetical protein
MFGLFASEWGLSVENESNSRAGIWRIRATNRTSVTEIGDYALDDGKELHFKTAAEFKRDLAESL